MMLRQVKRVWKLSRKNGRWPVDKYQAMTGERQDETGRLKLTLLVTVGSPINVDAQPRKDAREGFVGSKLLPEADIFEN